MIFPLQTFLLFTLQPSVLLLFPNLTLILLSPLLFIRSNQFILLILFILILSTLHPNPFMFLPRQPNKRLNLISKNCKCYFIVFVQAKCRIEEVEVVGEICTPTVRYILFSYPFFIYIKPSSYYVFYLIAIFQFSYYSIFNLISISIAQDTHSYSRRLPALGRILICYLVFPLKVNPLNLKAKNYAQNIPVGLLSSLIKI